jgi:lysyl-tRNA synthetase class 2
MASALPRVIREDAGWSDVVELLYREHVESELVQPTIVFDFPTDAHPCVISHPMEPRLGRHFDVVIGGIEIGSGGEDLTDPDEQWRRFAEQRVARGGAIEEGPCLADREYVDALAYGAPPASGAGIGIDRLAMVLLEHGSVREASAFTAV